MRVGPLRVRPFFPPHNVLGRIVRPRRKHLFPGGGFDRLEFNSDSPIQGLRNAPKHGKRVARIVGIFKP